MSDSPGNIIRTAPAVPFMFFISWLQVMSLTAAEPHKLSVRSHKEGTHDNISTSTLPFFCLASQSGLSRPRAIIIQPPSSRDDDGPSLTYCRWLWSISAWSSTCPGVTRWKRELGAEAALLHKPPRLIALGLRDLRHATAGGIYTGRKKRAG